MANEAEASTRANQEIEDLETQFLGEMGLSDDDSSNEIAADDEIEDLPGSSGCYDFETRPCDVIDSPNGTRQWIPIVSNDIKPIVGSVYSTFEDAKKAYTEYAQAAGFDTRLTTTKRNKAAIITHQYIVCNRHGYAKKKISVDTIKGKEKKGTKRNRSHKVTNCKAGIKLKWIPRTTSYQLYDFNESHNHTLLEEENMDMSKARRGLEFSDKLFIQRVCTSNIGPSIAHRLRALASGGRHRMRGTAVEYRNFWRDMKLYIGERDAQMLVDKMRERTKQVPTFSFEYRVDSDELIGLFWADEISKINYKAFGDVLSFDATYRTNKYKMSFVPFIGVDHHKRCVLFGAGLIKKEKADSYEWLLRCFIRAHGNQPDLVLTDQDPALTDAVPSVFDRSIHRLCTWHITNKIPIKMKGGAKGNSSLRSAIHKIVWNVHLTVEEFEERWQQVISDFNMGNHKWLTKMYGQREKWIPGYFSHIPFCCLMKTTSRSESTNAMFRVYSNLNNTLVQFMMCYENALEAQRFMQRKLDLETNNTTPAFCTELPIERFAASVYTHRLFTEVQKEIRKAVWSCSQTRVLTEEGTEICIIKDRNRLRQRKSEFKVTVNVDEEMYTCCCNNYIRVGYLCRHVFCVLKDKGVEHIPARYIHRRWRRDALPHDILKRNEKYRSENDKVNDLMAESISIVESCASRLRGNLTMLGTFVEKLEDLKKDVYKQVPNEPPENSKEEIFNSLLGVSPPREITVKAPSGIRNKGRKRLVGAAEKAKEKKKRKGRRCLYCFKYENHNIRTCKKRLEDIKAGILRENCEDDSAGEEEDLEGSEDEYYGEGGSASE